MMGTSVGVLVAGDGQRRVAIAGGEHPIAGLLQVVVHDLDDVRFVVHDEDCLVSHHIYLSAEC